MTATATRIDRDETVFIWQGQVCRKPTISEHDLDDLIARCETVEALLSQQYFHRALTAASELRSIVRLTRGAPLWIYSRAARLYDRAQRMTA